MYPISIPHVPYKENTKNSLEESGTLLVKQWNDTRQQQEAVIQELTRRTATNDSLIDM